jgi:hypothetical protein
LDWPDESPSKKEDVKKLESIDVLPVSNVANETEL